MKMNTVALAFAVLVASTSTILARGGIGGPIGPGSRDGLQPSVRDYRSDAFADQSVGRDSMNQMKVKKRSRRMRGVPATQAAPAGR